MQLEKIEVLNERLKDVFGIDTVTGLAMYRIVFANTQFEKRLCTHSPSGLVEYAIPQVQEMPKYQWLRGLYLIETLVVVPDMNKKDLPTQSLSYEPLFVFWDRNGKFLPPKWEVAEMAIQIVLAAKGKGGLHKYVDKEGTTEDAMLERKKRIDNMVEYFGGDESGLMGASLNSGSAAFVPHNYEKSE